MPANKTYRIRYDVHCTLQNFFGKEILVKNCWGELHAKTKLDGYAKKKYGIEFSCIVVKSCKEEKIISEDMMKDIFGNEKGDLFNNFNNIFGDAFGKKKK